MIRWFDSQGELDRAEQYRGEIDRLKLKYEKHRHPPALELYDLSPLFDDAFLLTALEGADAEMVEMTGDPPAIAMSIWLDRLASVNRQTQDAGEQSVGSFIDKFVGERKTLVETGQITAGWLEQLDFRLRVLKRFAGGLEVSELTAPQLSMFHRHILGQVVDGAISASCPSGERA